MTEYEVKIGQRVRSLETFSGVPEGTEGVIDEDYGTGIMVAWDLPNRPLPPGYVSHNGKPQIAPGQPLRDGFDKETELQYLEVVE